MLFLLVVGVTTAQAAPNNSNRFYGQDRFQTSISIARQLYQGQQVQNIVKTPTHLSSIVLTPSIFIRKLRGLTLR